MRWKGQEIEEDAQGRLPGYEEAVVRHFDAPEALDTRFYEVHAKSALNARAEGLAHAVPMDDQPVSRMRAMPALSVPSGDTAVLMADGRTRELRHIRAGDADLRHGDVGRYRRYVVTRVLDHWMVRKPAYRVTLENGTELITSGDHRLLSNRGWKYVTGAEQGRCSALI